MIIEKVCLRCKELKPIDVFALRDKGKYRRSLCRPCQKIYKSEHHVKERDVCRTRKKDRILANRIIIMEHLRTHPCVDCGETDPLVLQFDHLRDKRGEVCAMASSGVGTKTIIDEIDKCVVRCANDHTRKSMRESGCWRLQK